VGIKKAKMSIRENQHLKEFTKEHRDIESLMNSAIAYGIVKSEEKDALFYYLQKLFGEDSVIFDPTDLKFTNKDGSEGVRVPLTIKALKGILEQRMCEVEFMRERFSGEKKGPSKEGKGVEHKIRAIHEALAYVLDCHATGVMPIPTGKRNELEAKAVERKTKCNPNTFYKNYRLAANLDVNKESELIENAGEDWRETVLFVCKYPDKVDNYLKSKQL
jgi:hypothetical protein